MDTKTMSKESNPKPKQTESQPNSNARKLLNLPVKDSGSSVVRCNLRVNAGGPTGHQSNKSVTNSSTLSNVHLKANSNMHSNAALTSSNVPSHSTIGSSSSKPASMVVDSRKANRMANTRSLISRTAANQTTSSTSQTNQTSHPCKLCELEFDNINRLSFHLVKIHSVDKRIKLIQCYVDGCEEKFGRRMELVNHLKGAHELDVQVLRRTVTSLEEFHRWKSEIERESGCTWIQNNKFFLNNRLRMTYICDKPAHRGSRLYSLHGLATINNQSTFCLSSIKVTESEDGKLLIEFIETHNHDE